MRKIRLELDTLSVESFIPGERSRDVRGTVNAHFATRNCPPTTPQICEYTFSCPTGCVCTQ